MSLYSEQLSFLRPDNEQQTLPGVKEHVEAHHKSLADWQMTRSEWESDPHIMWHAGGHDELPVGSSSDEAAGIHFGSKQSATIRGQNIANEVGPPGTAPNNPFIPEGLQARQAARPVRLFSVQTEGEFTNTPIKGHPAYDDLPKGRGPVAEDQGESWSWSDKGRWYVNRVETDVDSYRGEKAISTEQLSGYVPQSEGFLRTHKDLVMEAHIAGENVPQNVMHEAINLPEYSDTIAPSEGSKHIKEKKDMDRLNTPKLFEEVTSGSSTTYVTPAEYNKMKTGGPIKATLGEAEKL